MKIFQRKLTVFKTIFDELGQIATIINEEKNWSKRALCRDKDGEQLFDPQDSRATSWCIIGACHKLNLSVDTFAFLDYMASLLGYSDVSRFNDYATWDEFTQFYLGCMETAAKPITKEKNMIKNGKNKILFLEK